MACSTTLKPSSSGGVRSTPIKSSCGGLAGRAPSCSPHASSATVQTSSRPSGLFHNHDDVFVVDDVVDPNPLRIVLGARTLSADPPQRSARFNVDTRTGRVSGPARAERTCTLQRTQTKAYLNWSTRERWTRWHWWSRGAYPIPRRDVTNHDTTVGLAVGASHPRPTNVPRARPCYCVA